MRTFNLNNRDRLLLRAARELAISHGIFFAAAFLADLGVPLDRALIALRGVAAASMKVSRGE